MTKRSWIALLLALSFIAAACGGDDDNGDEGAAGGGDPSDESSEFDPEVFDPEIFGDLEQVDLPYWEQSGGAGQAGKEQTLWRRFEELTGVRPVADFHCCGLAKLEGMQAANDVTWNFGEIATGSDYLLGKERGMWETLDPDIVPFDKLQEGTFDDTGYQMQQYTASLTYNTDVYTDEVPDTFEDLFDTEKFPGRRCFFNYPEFGATLEAALLADGVDPDDLYPLDIDRALAKLDTIKDDIVWWASGEEAVQFILDGECDMGMAWPGRTYARVRDDNAPLAMAWDASVLYTAYWAIPKGAPNVEEAQALLAFWILDTEGQKMFVEQGVPYPTPIEGLTLDDYPESVREWLPLGENIDGVVHEDVPYYVENIDEITETFNAWLAS